MLIEKIEPLSVLTREQVVILRELLSDRPGMNQSALVLYRLRSQERVVAMVAPSSPELRPGISVICAGWVASAQLASSDSEESLELQVSEALVAE